MKFTKEERQGIRMLQAIKENLQKHGIIVGINVKIEDRKTGEINEIDL
jgi:hypothetical protein